MADYKINDIYQGGLSTFKSNYGEKEFGTGATIPAGQMGLAMDPRTANILQEVSGKLSTGVQNIELSNVQPDVFESIPKNYFKEAGRVAKLAGAEITVHAPLVEASGMTKEGFSEANRQAAERQMMDAIVKANQVNPKGSSPVTFHSSAILPGPELQKTSEGKEIVKQLVINQETNQISSVEKDVRHYPGADPAKIRAGEHRDVEKELDLRNTSSWHDSFTQLSFHSESADKLIDQAYPVLSPIIKDIEQEKVKKSSLSPTQVDAYNKFKIAEEHVSEIHRSANSLFDKAYKYGSEDDKEKLINLSETFRQDLKDKKDLKGYSRALIGFMNELQSDFEPKIFTTLGEFTNESTTKTFANVAWDSYDKFGSKAPIISIENPPYGGAFSTGEELKEIVEGAREKFVEKAQEEGMSKSQATKQAKKLIGVTWDVGHINMMRKHGFEKEDILKETEAVQPLVKHVHLSDNFGMEHTELPMGMGNVPIKEIMDKLGKEGFEAKKVIEAGNWWQHFKSPPVKESFQAFGSPLYAMDMGSYWNQSLALQQGYFGGYGMMLPQGNYNTFGAGFSQLPAELGGQQPGAKGSNMSGRPME